jgi:hypothetical protein
MCNLPAECSLHNKCDCDVTIYCPFCNEEFINVIECDCERLESLRILELFKNVFIHDSVSSMVNGCMRTIFKVLKQDSIVFDYFYCWHGHWTITTKEQWIFYQSKLVS